MPNPNEHVCDIKPSAGYDRIRRESQDDPHPMHVAGKRVFRLFGFKGDQPGELLSYHFSRKDGWADSEAAARNFCQSHGGAFHPMTGKSQQATVVYLKGGPARSLVEATTGDSDELYWHPLVPQGHFDHPAYGEFTITPGDLDEMIRAFTAGIPYEGGIPIDEDGLHDVQGQGAFGWVEQVELREGTLWGGIRWTSLGTTAINDKRYKYVSPRFVAGAPEPIQGDFRSLIISVALCTRPFFTEQPELQVAASEYTRTEVTAADDKEALRSQQQARSKRWGIEVREDGSLTPPAAYREVCPRPEDYGDPVNFAYPLKPEGRLRNAATRMAQNYQGYQQAKSRRVVWTRIVSRQRAAGITHKWGSPLALDRLLPPDLARWAKKNAGQTATAPTGGATIMTEQEARTRYIEIRGDVSDEDWKALTAGVEDLGSFLAGIEATASPDQDKALSEAQARVTQLETELAEAKQSQVAATDATKALTDRVAQLETDKAEAGIRREIEATRFGNEAYSPAAVDVLVGIRMNKPGASEALNKHLADHAGELDKVPLGETAGLTATTAEGETDEGLWLEKKAITPEVKAAIKATAAERKISIKAAYEQYLTDKYEPKRGH